MRPTGIEIASFINESTEPLSCAQTNLHAVWHFLVLVCPFRVLTFVRCHAVEPTNIKQGGFFLQRRRTADATCGCATLLRVIGRGAIDTLRRKAPETLIVLQSALRSVVLEDSHTLETLERSAYC